MAATPTAVQILDATLEALADGGLARLSLERVALRAGVSRQTLYRHFGNRHSLIEATIVREEQRLIAEVLHHTDEHRALEPALHSALVTLLTWTRDHPLLGKLLATEPERLLPFLASGDAPVLAAARDAMVGVVRDRLPAASDPELAADLLARIMLSYAIDPPSRPVDEVAVSLAQLFVQGLGADTRREQGTQ